MQPAEVRVVSARLWPILLIAALAIGGDAAFAHDVSEADREAVAGIDGPAFVPFLYLGAFRKLGWTFDPKWAVLVFGLFHGMGLATKLQDLAISDNGLLINLIGFNLGVEVGQVLVLTVVVFALNLWRGSSGFDRGARIANWALVVAGLALTAYQLAGWIGP